MSEHATGTPLAIASSTGSPKPSWKVGSTKHTAAPYRPSSSASEIQPGKRTLSATASSSASSRSSRS